MNLFQTQRIDLQRQELMVIQNNASWAKERSIIQDNYDKERSAAHDGYQVASEILEKHGAHMPPEEYEEWYSILKMRAKEIAMMKSGPPVFSTPLITSYAEPVEDLSTDSFTRDATVISQSQPSHAKRAISSQSSEIY